MKPNTFEAQSRLHLQGKMVKECRYMTHEEAEQWGWNKRPLIIILSDGNWFTAMSDDEGNDAGALATSFSNLPTIPVLRARR